MGRTLPAIPTKQTPSQAPKLAPLRQPEQMCGQLIDALETNSAPISLPLEKDSRKLCDLYPDEESRS